MERHSPNYFEVIKGKNVYIFGAGEYGQKNINKMQKYRINISGIIDNNEQLLGKKINNIKVINLDTYLREKDNNSFIVICSSASDEIQQQLIDNNIFNFCTDEQIGVWDCLEELRFRKDIFSEYLFRLYGSEQQKRGNILNRDGEPIPWYTYPAIEYLSQFDFTNQMVFEYGCGYSTLWWQNRVKKVLSVDNNKEWVDFVKNNCNTNVNVLHKFDMDEYVSSIGSDNNNFDIIVIDGLCRDLCAEQAVKHIKCDGMIILDNSDRVVEFEEYKRAVETIKKLDFIQIDFMGIGPVNLYTWVTSVFVSRNIKLQPKITQPIKSIGGIMEVK